jgi:hypothetical protein
MPAVHVRQSPIVVFLTPNTRNLTPVLLLFSVRHSCAVDSGERFFVLCAYTGKEVVGCKVQTVIVVPDQVRWLRLRAVALREFL